MNIHVLPKQDIKEHEQSSTCFCQPEYREENGDMIFVHYAWDGRQFLERALEDEDIDDSISNYTLYAANLATLYSRKMVSIEWYSERVKNSALLIYKAWSEKGFTVTTDDNG